MWDSDGRDGGDVDGRWMGKQSERGNYYKIEDFSCLIGSVAVIYRFQRGQTRLGARRVHEGE